MTSAPELRTDVSVSKLTCPDCDGTGRVMVQHGDGYNVDAEDCRLCGGDGGWDDLDLAAQARKV